MSIQIYNTFSRTKEPLKPVEPGTVRMYVCGITAYDRCHIGHARSAVVFDAIFRHLLYRGYKVIYVRNFTDIDDKIINRAKKLGISTQELAQEQIHYFYQDMDRLYVLRPTVEPRATEHIPQIIKLIMILMKKGYAYESGGDVYFSVRRFDSYGALSRRDPDELRAGARIAIGEYKKDPLDFALWKGAKPGEPVWDSPWGPGRPGWHIECSAMSQEYLGETLDIHGGGLDLIFPHHENERAQSEAATGKTYVRIWVHNGFVTINGEKMSKSLGNFITIEQILKKHHPEALRLFLLSKHYRSPLDYSEKAMKEAELALYRCYSALSQAGAVIQSQVKKKRPLSNEHRESIKVLDELEMHFDRAMDDDFNTAMATGYLFEAVRALNRLSQEFKNRPTVLLKEPMIKAVRAIEACGKRIGIFNQEPEAFLRQRDIEALAELGMTEEQVLEAISRRKVARQKKDWATADAIRDELAQKGIILMDGPSGTTWTIKT